MAVILGDANAARVAVNDIAPRGVSGHPCFKSEVWTLGGNIVAAGQTNESEFQSRICRIPGDSRILDMILATNILPNGLGFWIEYRNLKPEGADATWTAISTSNTEPLAFEFSPPRNHAIFFSTLKNEIEFRIRSRTAHTAGTSEFIKLIVVYGNM